MKVSLLVSILGIGFTFGSFNVEIAALAQDSSIRPINEAPALPPASGSISDLESLENRSVRDWSWSDTYEQKLERQSGTYQVGGQNAERTAAPNRAIRDWKNSNRGEPRESSSGIPLTEF